MSTQKKKAAHKENRKIAKRKSTPIARSLIIREAIRVEIQLCSQRERGREREREKGSPLSVGNLCVWQKQREMYKSIKIPWCKVGNCKAKKPAKLLAPLQIFRACTPANPSFFLCIQQAFFLRARTRMCYNVLESSAYSIRTAIPYSVDTQLCGRIIGHFAFNLLSVYLYYILYLYPSLLSLFSFITFFYIENTR